MRLRRRTRSAVAPARLLPAVRWLALFEECAHALCRVRACEHPVEELPLQQKRAVHGELRALHRGDLDHAGGERWAGRNLLSVRQGLRHELVGGEDLINEADLQRLLGIQGRAGNHEIQSARQADQSWQALRAPGPWDHAQVRLGQANERVFIDHETEIARERDLETTSKAVPRDRRDEYLWRALDLGEDLVGMEVERRARVGVALL